MTLYAEPYTTPKVEKDYTGVANWQLSKVIQEYLEAYAETDSINDLADRIPMDPRDLRSVIDGKTKFNGLMMADRILLGMDINVTVLSMIGEITIIPAQGRNAPEKMARDEFWVKGQDPSPAQVRDRAYELAALRDQMLSAR